ncbi:MAG: TrkH family potassium uptake protein [Candidatus Omnitrophica bacterium]|nr:TrkH family potassium uptake protein [Candidatus Omnitrophota bacterium]
MGKLTVAIGYFMLIPMALSFFLGEYTVVLDFIIGFAVSLILGYSLLVICKSSESLNWTQGMVVVALIWLIAAFLAAIPLFFSGHFRTFLDAYFDAMSGFATTGLSVIEDLDHLSFGHNLWRHLIMFMGGQGIVVFALSFFASGASAAFRLYIGEARDEQLLPNVINTARFIWSLSIIYFIIGSSVLAFIGMHSGMPVFNSIFDGACIFMAAFDTGGFTPHSQSILYYHNSLFELTTVVIMILGALNFKLHYEIWHGNRKELRKNIEVIAFLISLVLVFTAVCYYLKHAGVYSSKLSLFFKSFYQVISAHTGTGFQTIDPEMLRREWSDFGLLALLVAMGFGGGICSTTGGIKMLRVGIIFKGVLQDINRFLLPPSCVLVQKIHHVRDIVLEEKMVRTAFVITFAFIVLYILGAIVATFLGYPMLAALFESTSAAANVGLSCGITDAAMPALLKVTYILQMWAGRLEFISVFILLGFIIAFIKGK